MSKSQSLEEIKEGYNTVRIATRRIENFERSTYKFMHSLGGNVVRVHPWRQMSEVRGGRGTVLLKIMNTRVA